jgi:lipoyl(octanoyl) transferase
MASSRSPVCILEILGTQPYTQTWRIQKERVAQKIADPQTPDYLLLVEHPPVYTLGTGSSWEFLHFDPQTTHHEWHRTERGGEVTYHCPGQIVGYPILDLNNYQRDLHWYLRQLESLLLMVLSHYGLRGERQPGLTGIWLQGVKVAAIGIKVTRWVTFHGFALNVCPDLTGFQAIVPCGLRDYQVGSLGQFLPGLTIEEVQQAIAVAFPRVFGVTWLKDDVDVGKSTKAEADVRDWGANNDEGRG